MFSPGMFGKYYLYQRLAVGGMAEIFRAKMYGVDGFEKNMVVKQILPQYASNKEFIQMFVDEAKITVSLSHGNIVPVFELGQIDGIYFIAMEEVDGKSLGEAMDEGLETDKRMSIEHALFVSSEMLAGLDYAHRKTDAQGCHLNIVHRDVSPQNILISYEGDVKLVDFGIARAATKVHATRAGVIKGKFGYMAPEQAMGEEVDARSDVFAAGILLYEMLTLERLFHGPSDGATLDRVKRADVPTPSKANPALSPKLESIVFKALAAKPDDRYQTAGEMRMAVTRHLYSLVEEASAKTLSFYMKDLFDSELAERAKQPPIVVPPEAHNGDQAPGRAPAPAPAPAPTPAQIPAAGPASNPEALFEPIAAQPRPMPDGAAADMAGIDDDFSYMRAGRRVKWIVVLLLLGLLGLGGIIFADDISRVFSTVGDVIDESAERLAQKKLGTLYVRSRPTGATVYFGGSSRGVTDIRIGNIDPTKEYSLLLDKEGFRSYSRKVLPADWKQDTQKMTIEVFHDFNADSLR